jgi:hypothetical protein
VTEEEEKELANKETFDALTEKYEQLLHKTEVSENKVKLLAIGYEEA